MDTDLILIGAGPVGLYGAYYAGFRGLRTTVVDALPQLGGQITAMYSEKLICDVAGFPAVRGRDLVDALAEQAGQFSPTYLLGEIARCDPALASKVFHAYSDFMLHDVGTGDGIVQNGGPATRNMIRTAPLWGLRIRTRLMHDGASLTPNDAILRHNNQAAQVIQIYLSLTTAERQQILAFLDTL